MILPWHGQLMNMPMHALMLHRLHVWPLLRIQCNDVGRAVKPRLQGLPAALRPAGCNPQPIGSVSVGLTSSILEPVHLAQRSTKASSQALPLLVADNAERDMAMLLHCPHRAIRVAGPFLLIEAHRHIPEADLEIAPLHPEHSVVLNAPT